MDDELTACARISDQLLQAISNTAVLLVIVSPGYVASQWCQRERNAFLRLVRERGAARVLVVEREAVDESDWPPELADLKVFRFWLKPQGKSPHILGSPRPEEEYYSRMEDLCFDLTRVLKQLKVAEGTPLLHAHFSSGTSPAQSQSRLAVYLARATYDLDSESNEIKRYLDQAGIRVLPETACTLEPVAFRELVERNLRECLVFVQLLSALPFRKPAISSDDYAELQLDLARKLSKRILQWRHPELDTDEVTDERHRTLLRGRDVRAEPLEDFKSEVRNRAFEKPLEAKSRQVSTLLFVNVDTLDRSLAEEVCASLGRLGTDFVLPRSLSAKGKELDPEIVREDLENNLRDCDALIIVYGNSDVGWVRRQLMQSRKMLATRKDPIQALAVFEGPPEDKQPLDIQLKGMQVVDCRKGFNELELKQFLDKVRVQGAS